MLASEQFIRDVLGDEYTEPVTDLINQIYEETTYNRPVLYLLSAGSDPTGTIDEYARKHKQFPTGKVSMGEAQEGPAKQLIDQAHVAGKWVILNNCHLSIEFMAEMEDYLNPKEKVVHENFRLFITCLPVNDFPLSLL